MSSSEITRVSDTALMVAACRAHEAELEDAFVRDPFAARLAGERRPAILACLAACRAPPTPSQAC
jgi:O-methyltransferase involved in polyketide biosynthesis